jgi:RNA polymerase sigma-70 factor (ECF subfamily)
MHDTSGSWDWDRLRTVCEREARRILRSAADIDDVAQAAMERAWRHRDHCVARHAPEGWVAAIARREALREYGRQRRLVILSDPPETPVAASDERIVETVAVDGVMRELSHGDRQMVLWRYADDLSSEEIGRRLGLSPGAVRVRLHRARRALGVALAD